MLRPPPLTDPWQTSVENRLAQFATDFRWTWGNMLAMFIAGTGGFAWMVDILFKMKTHLGFMQVQLATVQVPLDDTLG